MKNKIGMRDEGGSRMEDKERRGFMRLAYAFRPPPVRTSESMTRRRERKVSRRRRQPCERERETRYRTVGGCRSTDTGRID